MASRNPPATEQVVGQSVQHGASSLNVLLNCALHCIDACSIRCQAMPYKCWSLHREDDRAELREVVWVMSNALKLV